MPSQIRRYRVPVIDSSNVLLYYVRPSEVERLVLEGRVQARGSKSRIHVLVVIDHRDDHLLADERFRRQTYSSCGESSDNPPRVWKHKSSAFHWND